MNHEATAESIVAIAAWVLVFAYGHRLRWRSSRFFHAWLSAAAGVSIAYVFMDLLPEMSKMQESFTHAAEGQGFPFPSYRVYTSALLGFLIFFTAAAIKRSRTAGEQAEHEAAPVWIRLIGFTLYCGLIGYLLVEHTETGGKSLAVYAVAMTVHFMVVDHSLRRELGPLYLRLGRWLLPGGIVAGWLTAVAGFSSHIWIPTLLGLVGGGVIINSAGSELRETREGRGHLLSFILGAIGYAMLLLLSGA